eukprot:IDg12737t1
MAFVSGSALPGSRGRTVPRICSLRMARERTFVAVKPDGVNRGLVGRIVTRFEERGFQLIGMKALVPSRELAETHYEALSEKPFYPALVDFISSGPVCAMVWEGEDAVATARSMIGATNPRASAPGTIRGDFALDVGRNGSDAVETADREIGIWFDKKELCEWSPTQNAWVNKKPHAAIKVVLARREEPHGPRQLQIHAEDIRHKAPKRKDAGYRRDYKVDEQKPVLHCVEVNFNQVFSIFNSAIQKFSFR